MNLSSLAGPVLVLSALLACKSSDKQQSQSQGVAAPIAAPSSDVTFKRLIPKAGSKSTTSRKSTTKFTMSGKVYRETSVLDAVMEVKASDEFRVTKASIDVKELYKTSQEGTGTEKKSVSPISGSSYVVTRYDDGTLGAQDSNGNKVAPSLVKLIKEEFGSSFEKNQDAAFIPDRPVKLEEKLAPSSDTMLGMLGIKDDGTALVDGTEFFLKSATSSRATFDATMTMTQKVGSGMRVRAKLKGKFELQPEGAWLVGVDLTGPLTILDASGTEKGSGDLTFVATQTFTQ